MVSYVRLVVVNGNKTWAGITNQPLSFVVDWLKGLRFAQNFHIESIKTTFVFCKHILPQLR